MTRIQLIVGDYDTATSLLDDLGQQFPQGEYGKRTIRAKEEVEVLRSRESGKTEMQSASGQGTRTSMTPLGIAVWVLVPIAFGTLFLVGVLVLFKKTTDQDK